MATTKTPLLDLSTLVDRHVVRINKKTYQLRNSDELSFIGYRQFVGSLSRLGALLQKQTPTVSELQEQSKLIREKCAQILIAPASVLASLTDRQQLAIIEAFLKLLPETKKAMAAAGARKAKRARA
jgi:hypothetical protein